MEIGQRIKIERQTAEWTQEQLADRIFVSKRTISNWETGKTVPDIESVLRLAKIFKLSLDDLLVEDSAIVKEIKRKEELTNLSIIYYVGPVLTGLILMGMMYFSSALGKEGSLYLITAALLTNFITMCMFKLNIDRLRNKEQKFQQEMRQMKIVGTAMVVFVCIVLIVLHFI